MGCKYHGGHGVTKDRAVAAHWFRKAADGGCTGAQVMLGSMYESGDGVSLDLNVAKQLYTRAAARGDDVASFLLDRMSTREVQLRLGQQMARGGLSALGLACLVDPPEPVTMKYEPNGDDDDASSDEDEGGGTDCESADSQDDTGGDGGFDCDDEDGTDLYGGPGGWPGDF
jgi:TPR repeat protein